MLGLPLRQLRHLLLQIHNPLRLLLLLVLLLLDLFGLLDLDLLHTVDALVELALLSLNLAVHGTDLNRRSRAQVQ